MQADRDRTSYLYKGGNQNAETRASKQWCLAGAGSWGAVDGVVVGMADQLRTVGPDGGQSCPRVGFHHTEWVAAL